MSVIYYLVSTILSFGSTILLFCAFFILFFEPKSLPLSIMQLPTNYRQGKALGTLVENRTVYTMETAEMNIFETHLVAKEVVLDFSQPTLASMVMGKKVMHLRNKDPFAFLPGESIMLPAGEVMKIDFPEATDSNPTKCLALVVDEAKINKVLAYLNEERPKVDNQLWMKEEDNFHFSNDPAVHQIIQRLLYLFAENHPAKAFFIENMINELLVRILQTASRNQLFDPMASTQEQDERIRHILHYIRANLSEKMSVKTLSRQACMSESHFYQVFKNELGYTPVEFVLELRLSQAANMLAADSNRQIGDVCLACGFNNLSYFNRAFKKKYALTPSAYQQQSFL